jgi:hypothetical protein
MCEKAALSLEGGPRVVVRLRGISFWHAWHVVCTKCEQQQDEPSRQQDEPSILPVTAPA